jgi:hypothetical protein
MKAPSRFLPLAILAAVVLPVCAQQPAPRNTSAGAPAQRMMPPQAVTCDRNQLTSYSGAVRAYQRQHGATRLSIHTDWDTDESVELYHAGSDDPSPQFLLSGRPFRSSDWQQIESAPGILIRGMRATAWVCTDGENPTLIDWQPRR